MGIKNYSECGGWRTSACCGGSLILSDICSICKEHTTSQCVDCEDRINCEEIENTDKTE